MLKKYGGCFLEDGSFVSNGEVIKLPPNRWAIVHILEDEAVAGEDETTTITTLTFNVDKELYEQAEQVLKEIGMDMTCALNLFLQAVIREGRIPFEITEDMKNPQPGKEAQPDA